MLKRWQPRSHHPPGVSTADLNAAAEEVLKKYGVYSPFKNYPGPYPYPASTCVSVNEELVHGIPDKKRKLKEGDIVSVDCGTVYEGFVADSAFTAGVGEISPEAASYWRPRKSAVCRDRQNGGGQPHRRRFSSRPAGSGKPGHVRDP